MNPHQVNQVRLAPADPRTAIAGLATARGWQVRAMEKVVPSLEEAFISIVGRER